MRCLLLVLALSLFAATISPLAAQTPALNEFGSRDFVAQLIRDPDRYYASRSASATKKTSIGEQVEGGLVQRIR
jgi:hypothetical protein